MPYDPKRRFRGENISETVSFCILTDKQNSDPPDMQSIDERRRKYCANCGKEIRPGQGIELNYRYSVCSEDCKKEFNKGKIS